MKLSHNVLLIAILSFVVAACSSDFSRFETKTFFDALNRSNVGELKSIRGRRVDLLQCRDESVRDPSSYDRQREDCSLESRPTPLNKRTVVSREVKCGSYGDVKGNCQQNEALLKVGLLAKLVNEYQITRLKNSRLINPSLNRNKFPDILPRLASRTAQVELKRNSRNTLVDKPQTSSRRAYSRTQLTNKGTSKLLFSWPIVGKVISRFGDKGVGGKVSNGISFSVPHGVAVRAAERGKVIYFGKGIRGYGTLILIHHPTDWVSVYAHVGSVLVDNGTTVERGQLVALTGVTNGGSKARPRLYFELRKGKMPVNPELYIRP